MASYLGNSPGSDSTKSGFQILELPSVALSTMPPSHNRIRRRIAQATFHVWDRSDEPREPEGRSSQFHGPHCPNDSWPGQLASLLSRGGFFDPLAYSWRFDESSGREVTASRNARLLTVKVRMACKPGHSLAGQSMGDVAGHLSSTYYLESDQHEFPRNLTCTEGTVVRLVTISRSPAFSSRASSLRYICIPSSIEAVAKSSFKVCLNLSN
jgi:hypothetical protein